jgi:alkylation response protein AidB-like acyl-CoA dehydrogenase
LGTQGGEELGVRRTAHCDVAPREHVSRSVLPGRFGHERWVIGEMDVELTEDQELFRDTTRRFLEGTAPISTVREWAENEPAGYPAHWWQEGAELGWTALLVPEECGGGTISGHGLLDLILVAEEMGRLVSPGPLLPVNLVATAVAEGGTEEQRTRVLPGLLSGEQIASWCLEEPDTAFGHDGISVAARLSGGGFILDGVKGPIEGAAEADWFVVVARSSEGVGQFLVPSDTPGLTVSPLESLDLNRRFATVRFQGVELGPEGVLSAPGQADDAIEKLTQIALVLQCVEMAGAIDAMFQRTLEYSFDRYSFGRPLASYQALKHRFADMKLWIEACHATAGGAARAVDARSNLASELARVAKAYVGERAPAILQDCVQLHGGIGVTWDHDLHLYLRRVVQDRALFGTPTDHREEIASISQI